MGTGFPLRSCSNKKIELDDDSKKSHPALTPWIYGFSPWLRPSVSSARRFNQDWPFGRRTALRPICALTGCRNSRTMGLLMPEVAL